MIHGFDSPLSCEGIIGDGCGADRIFFIEEDSLNVYDKNTIQINIQTKKE